LNLKVTLDVSDHIAPAMPASTVVIKYLVRMLTRPPLPYQQFIVTDERPGRVSVRALGVPTI
jgi:hypothetical protein